MPGSFLGMRDTSGKKRDKVLPRSNRSKDNKRTYLSRRIIIRISYPRLEVKPLEQCLAHESCSSINSSYYLKQEMSISTIWKKYAGGTLKKKKKGRVHWRNSPSVTHEARAGWGDWPPAWMRLLLPTLLQGLPCWGSYFLIKGGDVYVIFDT